MTDTPSQTAATRNAPDDAREATRRRRDENLARIGSVLAVMSGKGGVGKSTVAAALATSLARQGRRTGLLDVDFHGPSVPGLLGLGREKLVSDGRRLQPVEAAPNLRVMSLGLLLGGGDEAVIWRGPMKIGVIDQLLGDVEWGTLDVLVVDCPPGTGDEPLSIGQVIPMARVVMVGTPQEVAMADVRKAVDFCRKLGLRLEGLVETMGRLVCPSCGEEVPLFRDEGATRPDRLPRLAEIPFDPALREACDRGRLASYLAEGGPAAEAMASLAGRLLGADEPNEDANPTPAATTGGDRKGESSHMRYAIPTADGQLALHFGHADRFTLVDVEDGEVTSVEASTPPPHAPGVLPQWLKEQGVDLVIAGGMGRRAQSLFAQHGIETLVGAPAEAPEDLVRRHLAGTLATGENICDH
jgi:Mrp family chromosome partitioning ATPase/predicted Fe-Mo cluster-binding NifX family protein